MPEASTSHLFVLHPTSAYTPLTFPSVINVHPDFDNGLDFLLDGALLDTVSTNPTVVIIDDQGDNILILEIDASFSNLVVSSDIFVIALTNWLIPLANDISSSYREKCLKWKSPPILESPFPCTCLSTRRL